MADPVERRVNLALYLASCRTHVTAEQCRNAGLGYPEDQDETAFLRMFERDKEFLRAAGIVIDVVRDDEAEAYRFDPMASYARPVELTDAERAVLKVIAAALAADPGFPFGDDLAIALGKITDAGQTGPLATAELAAGGDDGQAPRARALAEAVLTRKSVTFGYTNQSGESKSHRVDPYGVFFREGVWYLIGQDRDLDARRTYAIERMRDLDVNPRRPRTPDFERPEDFDVREHEKLPFQYGAEALPARVRFEPDVAWRADRLIRGHGTLAPLPDGSVVWDVEARDLVRLAQWIVTEGPAVHAVEPPDLVETLRVGLREVVDRHA